MESNLFFAGIESLMNSRGIIAQKEKLDGPFHQSSECGPAGFYPYSFWYLKATEEHSLKIKVFSLCKASALVTVGQLCNMQER